MKVTKETAEFAKAQIEEQVKKTSWPAWVKYLISGLLAGGLAVAYSLGLVSCTAGVTYSYTHPVYGTVAVTMPAEESELTPKEVKAVVKEATPATEAVKAEAKHVENKK